MSVLIIGGGSVIGRALTHHLTTQGRRVITTSRHQQTSNSLWLDLANDESIQQFEIPSVEHCIILASVTSLAACEASTENAHRINVHNTIKLIKRLDKKGIFTVFPSSNQVFDPYSTHNSLDTQPKPVNSYGQMKLEVETFIQQECKCTAILRLGKVVSGHFALLEHFVESLLAGETVSPYSNYTLAPISISLCCEIISGLLKQHVSGIFQVSSIKNISYFDLLTYVCSKLGIDTRLIKPALMISNGKATPVNNSVMESNVGSLINQRKNALSIEASLVDLLPTLKAMRAKHQ